MKKLTLGICIATSSLLFAALPPFFQSKKEIIALLEEPQVVGQLGSHRPIDSITKSDKVYTIKSNNCSLRVSVDYLPQPRGWVGPSRFSFDVGELDCQ